MKRYIARRWGSRLRLRDLETIQVNGLEAATGAAKLRGRSGTLDARVVAYRIDTKTICRFIFLTPVRQTAQLSTNLRRTTFSFRRLSRQEAGRLKPLVLRILTVRRGDTVNGFARRMPFADFQIERFEVLNGISRNDTLRV